MSTGATWRRVLSWVAVLFGWLQAVGMWGAANFDEKRSVAVHRIFAGVLFGGAVVYIWLSTILSLCSIRLTGLQWVMVRVGIGAIMTTALAIHQLANIFHIFVTDKNADIDAYEKEGGYTIRWLPPTSPFYLNHIMATTFEWITAITGFAYFLTYIAEFKRTKVTLPRMIFTVPVHPDTYEGDCVEAARDKDVVFMTYEHAEGPARGERNRSINGYQSTRVT